MTLTSYPLLNMAFNSVFPKHLGPHLYGTNYSSVKSDCEYGNTRRKRLCLILRFSLFVKCTSQIGYGRNRHSLIKNISIYFFLKRHKNNKKHNPYLKINVSRSPLYIMNMQKHSSHSVYQKHSTQDVALDRCREL